ncbi:DMP19 family protein [Sinomonas halotolerans]|uniref:DNA mimic protein DMP19 C-terminal domain-containing protein n=1 Tax=Sinomonas halotolerans TaxID=1644133 RepID=A0ABU9X1Z5_9MICC
MSTDQNPVVLPAQAVEAGSEAVVDANVDVVNAMYEELLDEREIAADALRSYYVDFYLTQSLEGGFAQYVVNSGDHHDIDQYVRDGLRAMGAERHAALFDELVSGFEALGEDDAEAYLDGDSSVPAVQRLEELDDRFDAVQADEDLVSLNGAWLSGAEGLLALDEDGIEDEIARRVGLIDDLEERRAEAEVDALADMPDFELVIRELCDVAGHELAEITMGDPNYRHEGVKTLAWRFTTDKGAYVMVEEDDEAYMIDPETQEVLAAVEFEELDEDEWQLTGVDGAGLVQEPKPAG